MASVTSPAPDAPLGALIRRWREDPGSTYRTWFLWEERLKNSRSIRRGIRAVVRDIESGTFGTQYRGSSMETVVHSVAEQRQILKGADHAFLWKPKLRIPDIYESPQNQRVLGQFLDACVCCTGADELVEAVRTLDRHRIKGLGPAAANLMYFLHPTHMPPFNTAIVNGYNALTGARVKLGSWEEYLALREGLFRLTAEHRQLLSNDLGTVAGLMFDLGQARFSPPPRAGDELALNAWKDDLACPRGDGLICQSQERGHRERPDPHRSAGLAPRPRPGPGVQCLDRGERRVAPLRRWQARQRLRGDASGQHRRSARR